MRRLAVVLPALVVLVGLYLIATRGGVHHPVPVAPVTPTVRAAPLPRPRSRAQARRPVRSVPPVTPVRPVPPVTPVRPGRPGRPVRPVVTSSRTDCRWHHYRDGALGSDPSCAPGALDPAVAGHAARTICNPRWLAATGGGRLPPETRDRLVIDYQLPGPVSSYVVARVVPIEDGGSPTDPRNLYVLPLDGWGGERTQAVVADRLHNQICAHRVTVAQAARTLEGNWLGRRVPVE